MLTGVCRTFRCTGTDVYTYGIYNNKSTTNNSSRLSSEVRSECADRYTNTRSTNHSEAAGVCTTEPRRGPQQVQVYGCCSSRGGDSTGVVWSVEMCLCSVMVRGAAKFTRRSSSNTPPRRKCEVGWHKHAHAMLHIKLRTCKKHHTQQHARTQPDHTQMRRSHSSRHLTPSARRRSAAPCWHAPPSRRGAARPRAWPH